MTFRAADEIFGSSRRNSHGDLVNFTLTPSESNTFSTQCCDLEGFHADPGPGIDKSATNRGATFSGYMYESRN